MEAQGIKLGLNYNDCGQMYFTRNQNTLSGGSGCGCSATVLNSFIIKKLRKGELGRVLFMPTGALMSTTASQQGETIPGVCHAIVIESDVIPPKVNKGTSTRKINTSLKGNSANRKSNMEVNDNRTLNHVKEGL